MKKANDKKSVVAFLAVEVIDMVRAPKCLVIAAEQLEPKKPMVENRTMTDILPATDHVGSSLFLISSYVPGRRMNLNPSVKSPLKVAAAKMARVAML